MSVKKVIITTTTHPVLQNTLERNGWHVTIRPKISYDELKQLVGEYEGLIVATSIGVDRSLLDAAVNLKWVGRLGSGMELIDTEYAATKNISCYSSPEGNRDAVAEHALGMLLNQLHHISNAWEQVKQGIWKREANRGLELRGKTIGLIGYGNTGMSFAALLRGFGVEILVYDKYKTNFSEGPVIESDLNTIMERSDVISFHVPLTEETFHMGGTEFFNSLKKKPIILNTSRGSVVDTEALLMALEKGQIRSASLDVLENESIEALSGWEKSLFKRLVAHPDVLITPHIAGYSQESFYKLSRFLLEKLGFEAVG